MADDDARTLAPEGTMSLWDHLDSLRGTIARSTIAVAICFVGVFAFVPWIFDHIVMAAASSHFFLYRLLEGNPWAPDAVTTPFAVEIINIRLASQFFMHMSLALWLALIIAFPYVLYQIWLFICPALYDDERPKVRGAFIFGTVMFYIGCFVGYALVFPLTLRFLYTYELSAQITNQLALDSYMDNFLMMVFIMGLVFELPLVALLLAKLGILKRSFFGRYRRHAIVAALALAAIITPSSDPFTLLAVFIPLYGLWEFSALLIPRRHPDIGTL